VKCNGTGECLFMLVFIISWVMGVVIAKGFWSTFFTVVFFPYSFYLVVERIMEMYGILV